LERGPARGGGRAREEEKRQRRGSPTTVVPAPDHDPCRTALLCFASVVYTTGPICPPARVRSLQNHQDTVGKTHSPSLPIQKRRPRSESRNRVQQAKVMEGDRDWLAAARRGRASPLLAAPRSGSCCNRVESPLAEFRDVHPNGGRSRDATASLEWLGKGLRPGRACARLLLSGRRETPGLNRSHRPER